MTRRNRTRLAWAYTAGWLANLGAGMVPSLHYEPSLLVTAPVMLILGAVFATSGRTDHNDAD